MTVKEKKKTIPIYRNEKIFHKNWIPVVEPIFMDKRYKDIGKMMIELHQKKLLTPSIVNVFKVFQMNPFDIKVLILGLAPYFSITNTPLGKTRSANGRAFAVPYALGEEGLSPSLKVLIDALAIQYEVPSLHYYEPFDLSLQSWEDQGVMLLNRYLTSEINNSNSLVHKDYWEWFTNALIKNISDQFSSIVFHLWGQKAQTVGKFINLDKHYIIKASHPQASNYLGGVFDFSTEDVFLKTDKILKNIYGETIKWC